jgi:hypothetical protein
VSNKYRWRVELRTADDGIERLYVSVLIRGKEESKELSDIPNFLGLMEGSERNAPGWPSALAFADFVWSTAYFGGFASNPLVSSGGLAGLLGTRKTLLEWNWPKEVIERARQIRERLK